MSGEAMQVARPAPAVVRFDAFEVDLQAGELRKDNRRIKIQEQPFRVLSLLLERVGRVVTREDLREKLWPADTFVDFDHGLNSAVARLREALGDSADEPRYIETIAKRGYRFVAILDQAPPTTAENIPVAPVMNPGASGNRASGKIWIGATFFFALFSAAAIWALYRPNADSQLSRIEVVPLVGLKGYQATPAFSPDGKLVAFRQSDGARNTGIYAAAVGGEKSLQLTIIPATAAQPGRPTAIGSLLSGILIKEFPSIRYPLSAGQNAAFIRVRRR
jgi:DNA-binding winged helix-turn-helix (wHTH) protein